MLLKDNLSILTIRHARTKSTQFCSILGSVLGYNSPTSYGESNQLIIFTQPGRDMHVRIPLQGLRHQ